MNASTDHEADETLEREPYRDGTVHVMSEKCSTCVFHPGNLMHLRPGRMKELTDHVQQTGVPFVCHQTLPFSTADHVEYYDGAALCAGSVEAYGAESQLMQMAEQMDVVTKVEPYRSG